MRFKLKRACKHCPFRSDRPGFLSMERAEEIALAVTEENQTFTCHQTISGEWEEDEEGIETEYRGGEGDQMCAGALLFVERVGKPNAMIQIAERLGLYDPSRLDRTFPVFDTVEAMVEANA